MARGDWQDTSCSKCGAVIHYHVDWDRIPTLCSDCREEVRQERAKWHETSCQDCGATIKYHEDWSRIPDLCASCRQERKRLREEANAKWHEKQCIDCSTTIRYHEDWDRIPDLCPSCRERRKREREEREAKWRETSCSRCHATIKYNIDWARVPTLCKDCVAKAKEERAKWHEKNCAHCHAVFRYHEDWSRIPDYCKMCNTWLTKTCEAQGCNEEIRYKVYWTNVPTYCRPCKQGEREVNEQRARLDGGWDEYTGWGYVNKYGTIVFVDDGPHGKHSHTVYRADGTLVGYREEGHEEDWVSEEWKETPCRNCGTSIRYHVDWDRIPDLCETCREERRREPGLSRNAEVGIHGEIYAEQEALQNFHFQSTDYEPPLQNVKGIDRIYRDGDELVIVEAKSVQGYPPSVLHETQHDRQMSRDWIMNHAASMSQSDIAANKALGEEILHRFSRDEGSSVRRILINVHPETGEITSYETTDQDANTWTLIDPMDE